MRPRKIEPLIETELYNVYAPGDFDKAIASRRVGIGIVIATVEGPRFPYDPLGFDAEQFEMEADLYLHPPVEDPQQFTE